MEYLLLAKNGKKEEYLPNICSFKSSTPCCMVRILQATFLFTNILLTNHIRNLKLACANGFYSVWVKNGHLRAACLIVNAELTSQIKRGHLPLTAVRSTTSGSREKIRNPHRLNEAWDQLSATQGKRRISTGTNHRQQNARTQTP